MPNVKRVFQFAFTDFYRNKGISIAAIFILIITTLLVTGLFFMRGISSFLIVQIQNKIDITAYFKSDTAEQDILNVKNDIQTKFPTIKNIQYVSQADALSDFTKRHSDNAVFSKALTEVGDNPFLPSLNIITNGDINQYQQISDLLGQDSYSNLIEKVDFSQKKDTIQKVLSITSNINKFGLILGAILILIAMLVVFNNIKLVVDFSRDEIATMRVVGASNWFIKSPFIIEGALFGFVSFIFCFLVTLSLSYFLSSVISFMIPGFNLFSYFILNAWIIVLIQLVFGVGLGVIASSMAVSKHLKV